MSLFLQNAVAQSGPVVWIAPSLHRVGKTDAAGVTTQATLSSARNGHAPFQIVVTGPSGGLSGVNLSISDLTGPGTIPHTSFTLYREQYVYVNSSSPNWGGSNRPLGAGWYADGLVPFVDPVTGTPLSGASITAVPCSVSAAQNQPFWVDLLIPPTAPAGQYSGTYTVTSAQGTVTGPISLTVWNFNLPATPSLKSAFQFWTMGTTVNQEQLLQHRLFPVTVSISDEPILMGSYGLSTTDVGPYSGASAGNCVMSAAPPVSTFQSEAAAQAPGLSLYDYSADEIGSCTKLFTTVQQWAYNMHQAGINNLITMAPTPALYSDGSGTGRSAVDTWVMLPAMYDSAPSNVTYVQQKGDSTWSYNDLVQDAYSPKWEIDFDPINFRIQPGFISQSLGLNGLLYWRVDDWIHDPWVNVNNAGTFSSNNYPGEGQMFYPGTDVGATSVVPSMRLKWLRDGVEDYDYVQILKNLGNTTQAMQIANSVGPNWTNWTRDPSAIDSARLQLGQAINQLVGGGSTLPSAPTSPSPANAATNIALTPALSWAGSVNTNSYDVYFGMSSNPSLAATVTSPGYSPGTLSSNTTYSWKVVAKNSSGSSSSTIWSFTTIPAPSAPTSPSPANAATNIAITTALGWAASTNATSYAVYFGTSPSPPLVGTTMSASYNPGNLSNSTTYYWKVMATGPGGSTPSVTWSFTTKVHGQN